MVDKSNMRNNGDAALELAEECGWHVFPCWGIDDAGRCRCGNPSCDNQGKHPLGRLAPKGLHNATVDSRLIRDWWKDEPTANIGVRTGAPSGMFVLDLDCKKKGGASGLSQFASLDPDGLGIDGVDGTPKATTGSGGRHLFYCLPTELELRNSTKVGGREIDVRADNGYVVADPSRNAAGPYRWELHPTKFEPVDAPQFVLDLITGKIPPLGTDGASTGLTLEFIGTLKDNPGAKEGDRNKVLCKLVGAHLGENGVDDDVLPLAMEWGSRCKPPMPPEQIRKTVLGLVAKHCAKATEAVVTKEKAKPTLIVTPYSEIAPQSVDWLWFGRIAVGKVTNIVGDPGLGKTFISTDISSRVSTGSDHPDGTPCPLGKVLFLTAEDGAADTIRPRLDAHNADVANIFHIEGVAQGDQIGELLLDRHIEILTEAVHRIGNVKLIVVDPITAYMGAANGDRNTDVRGVLRPLARLAEDLGVAILTISHLSKATQQKSIYRTLGSIGFTAAARAAWGVVKDPEDESRRLFLPIKNNLADAPGLAFSIEDGKVAWDPTPLTIGIDDLGDGGRGEVDESPREDAAKWIRAQLCDGPVPGEEILSRARKQGIPLATLKRAKASIGVRSEPIGKVSHWMPPARVVVDGKTIGHFEF